MFRLKFFKNWNIGKHIALVLSFYAAVAAITNAVLFLVGSRKIYAEIDRAGSWVQHISPEEKKRAAVRTYVREPRKSFKIANGIIGACCIVDLASYPLVKKMCEKL